MRIGEIDVVALSDGVCRLPQDFYVGLDFAGHEDLLAPDGRVHIPIGCFLLRTPKATVLVDAGIGAVADDWVRGGELPAALEVAGVAPPDIDVVVCTHLHIDHIGWLVVGETPFFPEATVRYGVADRAHFDKEWEVDGRGRRIMEVLDSKGRLDPLDGDLVPLAPGVTARHMPGHTPGHYGLVVASEQERAFILGDAVECPLQLEEPDFHALSDVDPSLSARTREALWRELEGTAAVMTGAHFPGLAFGRVMVGRGRRYFSGC